MHLVHQNIFEFDCASKKTGKVLQDTLSIFLQQKFYPQLEILLNRYEVPDQVWKIDNLNLELPEIKAKNWQKDLCKNALEEIEKYLKTNQPKSVDPGKSDLKIFHSEMELCEKLFFQFLKTGMISENTFSRNLATIISKIELTPAFLQSIISIFEEDPQTVIRYYFNISESFKTKIKQSIITLPISEKWKPFFINEVKFKNISDLEKRIFNLAKENLTISMTQMDEIQNEISTKKSLKGTKKTELKIEKEENLHDLIPNLNQIKAENKSEESLLKKTQNVNTSRNSALNLETFKGVKTDIKTDHQFHFEENIYIDNSGLIILHPFLKALFEQCDLCKNHFWTSEESQHKAVLLTQYLTNSKEEIFENDLVLNKILCGLTVECVVNTKLVISQEEKERCKNLLKAVLEYWKSLNNSSAETLQETFLQRKGKLSFKNNHPELWVEEKGVDVLLQELPWGIGTIKTPWMNQFLICNWR